MSGEILARYSAAVVDNAVAMFIAVVAAKQLPDEQMVPQMILAVTAYLGFFFIFERLFSATPGKLFTGLRVRSSDGTKCSTKQVALRTITRILEVNPLLLGAIPAAILIIWTADRRRLGDRFAGTNVDFR
ncbi:MAG: RDD family protein [Planctomycetota bacterium]